ncbi:MAG TPA: GNAT family N-acetyltransferase [Actinomycetes bacterium]|nr:GNAT family N-acetyltransferase [Actinomycetes bacterium]
MSARLRLEPVGLERGRALVEGHLDALAPLHAGAGWPHADTMDGLRMSLAEPIDDEQTALLAVLVDTDEVVGEGGWKGPPGPDGVVEIGYGLAPPYRGRGLGSELVGLLTAWVLDQEGVRRVVAEVLADNLPSRRALERNGYRLTHVDEPYVWYAYAP